MKIIAENSAQRKTFRLLLTALLLLSLLVVFAFAAHADAPTGKAEEAVYTETVPFEVVEDPAPAKPAYEDLASRFLTIEQDVIDKFTPTMVNTLIRNFSRVYPTLAETFNHGVMYNIVYKLDEQNSAAYETGGRNAWERIIAMNPDYFMQNRGDLGALTHELTHAMQVYTDSRYGAANTAEGGSWITEGIADWSRFNFDFQIFSLPSYESNQSYTDSYRVTARFFAWVDLNVDTTFMEQFNEALRCERYTSQFFKRITGKTLDELWQLYAASDHRVTKK